MGRILTTQGQRHRKDSRELLRRTARSRCPSPPTQLTSPVASTSSEEFTKEETAATRQTSDEESLAITGNSPPPRRLSKNSTSATISQLISAVSGMFVSRTCGHTEGVNENHEASDGDCESNSDEPVQEAKNDHESKSASTSRSPNSMANLHLFRPSRTLVSPKMTRWSRGSRNRRRYYLRSKRSGEDMRSMRIPYKTWLDFWKKGIDITYADLTRAEKELWKLKRKQSKMGKQLRHTNLRYCWTIREQHAGPAEKEAT
ncbi:hypothetical protein ACMFMF_002634 [Clarireedia jacksonii]